MLSIINRQEFPLCKYARMLKDSAFINFSACIKISFENKKYIILVLRICAYVSHTLIKNISFTIDK